MQAWFNILIFGGMALGLVMGTLAHPKFYAAVFRKKRTGSADHEHSID